MISLPFLALAPSVIFFLPKSSHIRDNTLPHIHNHKLPHEIAMNTLNFSILVMFVACMTVNAGASDREQNTERKSLWDSWGSSTELFSSTPREQPYVERRPVISNTNYNSKRDMNTALHNNQIPEPISNEEADEILVRQMTRESHFERVI